MKARKRNARTLARRPPSSNSKLERRHFRVLAVVEVRRVWTLRRVLGDSSDLGLYIGDPARLLNYQQILIKFCKLSIMRNHPTRNRKNYFFYQLQPGEINQKPRTSNSSQWKTTWPLDWCRECSKLGKSDWLFPQLWLLDAKKRDCFWNVTELVRRRQKI